MSPEPSDDVWLQETLAKICKQQQTPAVPNPPPLSLEQASTRWWWTQSEAAFQLFKNNSDAQGYELLRRLPKYRQQRFFRIYPETTWLQFDLGDQLFFMSQNRRVLTKLGLAKQIFFSPMGIVFDCRLPSRYLIEALNQEMRKPMPLITGTYGPSLVPNPINVKELPFTAYTKQSGNWEVAFELEPYMIRLQLPEATLNGDQIICYFTTFVKDNPPPGFAKHRRKFPKIMPKRRPFKETKTLSLALMVLDFADVAKLSRWLMERPSICKNVEIAGTQEQIVKRLYNAPRFLRNLPS